jgi:hypothetical protein
VTRRLVSASDVSIAARVTLETHLPAHLATGVRPLPAPTSYKQVPEEQYIVSVDGSTIAIMAPGLTGQPVRSGDGSYTATWVLTVAYFHEDRDDMPLLTAAGDALAAIVECLVQHPTLGGVATSCKWTSQVTDLYRDAMSNRLLGYGIAEFEVPVRAVVGTVPPPVDGTPSDGPTVVETQSTVTIRRPAP